jgi:hypothetical protein
MAGHPHSKDQPSARPRPLLIAALAVTFCLMALMFISPVLVLGFAEEGIGFRDRDGVYYPPTADFPDGYVSTVHDDLTYALALAAGFTVTDSHTLRVWDQLVDSEMLPGTPVSYTYGSAGFYPAPNPRLACIGHQHNRQIWPAPSFNPTSAATTSRFGPYSPFFHFPHRTGSDLQALHDWGWGTAATLVGYEAYAWGRNQDLTLTQAAQNDGCIITRTAVISMPVAAGSLEAFATYLHSLADAYSHEDCLNALAAFTPTVAWGTHTVPALGDPSIYACDYNPSRPTDDDAHGREFGPTYADTQRTVAAALAVYGELSARSRSREGVYVPLPLTTSLVVNGTATTLEGAIDEFVRAQPYQEAAYRRAYADRLVTALQGQSRTAIDRGYLPLILR